MTLNCGPKDCNLQKDKLFQEYSKKEIINGFAQIPISLDNLVQEVSNQLHGYELEEIPAS